MQVFHRLEEISAHIKKGAVAIGNFDGVHLGHQALLSHALRIAKTEGASSVVLTFHPHPVEVLGPGKRLERLTTTSEKLALLEGLGVDCVLVQKFDRALASLPPQEFFDRFLVQGLKAMSVHVGFNFMFGKGRAGNTDVLRRLCGEKGIQLQVEDAFAKDIAKVDSSTIRSLIREGNVLRAAELLGRPYFLAGRVAHGDHRGTQIGFPTANLQAPEEKVLPKNGVYLTRVTWQREVYRAVTNVGIRPTFQGGTAPRVEVHLLDFSARLYDELLQVEFFERIRDEKKFDSVEALKAQIQKDVESARASKSFSI